MIRSARKLLAIMALFAAPIAASFLAFQFFRPEATANYGELLVPPAPITTAQFLHVGGGVFRFEELRGKWVLIASDSGACPESCVAKLVLMRQLRLMLGRNANRVVRVFVADDTRPVSPGALAPSRAPWSSRRPREWRNRSRPRTTVRISTSPIPWAT